MEFFYGTFMNKQALKNKYVTIIAENEALARACMFAHFGDKFMTVYTASQFEGQPSKYNLTELVAIMVIDHGLSVEYIIT